MKAIKLLKADRDFCQCINNDRSIIEQYDEAIKELEGLQNTINTVIEEINYALTKPEFARDYLSNAKRFLIEI